MVYFKYNLKRNYLIRIKHNSDFIKFIAKMAKKEKIEVAAFTAVGALKWAVLGFYNQIKQEYQEIKVDSNLEIASCIGNISSNDGEPFVHAHVVLADERGNAKAGHLLEGKVFAAEVHLRELEGIKLQRKYDKVTGLSLWKNKK